MSNHSLPLVRPLAAEFDLTDAFRALAIRPGCVWFDTVSRGPFVKSATDYQGAPGPEARRLGRYSFLSADPIDQIVAFPGDPSPWPALRSWARRLPSDTADFLPPFQGGIAGLIGFESAQWLEPIPQPRIDDFPTPAFSIGLYDWTIATDHERQMTWLICQGLGGQTERERLRLANERADQVESWLSEETQNPTPSSIPPTGTRDPEAPKDHVETRRRGVWSNLSSQQYRDRVVEIIDRIRRGDSFQVNLAQRLLVAATMESPELYLRLRQSNAAPFGGYYAGESRNGGSFQVLSSSPEGFLQIRDGRIVTRPIKGTVARTGDPEVDLKLAKQLLSSEKDRAENTMIVDLMRNDLSRVCTDESVKVTQLCGLEQYDHVQHLVSVVEGDLRPEVTAVDALAACFPGGSVTGAPKIEAIRTIAELEPHSRGPYCGSLGYMGCGGAADFNILIRTITATGGHWQIPVGGGITAQSDPESEEAETWAKAEGMLRAMECERAGSD